MAHPFKILVVENEESTRRAIHRLVASESRWEVQSAEDAHVGFALAREFRPDLILSDYDMPGTDGFEFCEQIKAEPSIDTPLFVMLTAYADTPLKVRGLQRGADDYLTKPVEASELLAKITAMLRIKQLHDELRREKQELQRVQAELARGLDQLIGLLRYVLDQGVPGAGARGDRLADWALRVAERFGIPEKYLEDLRHAARLHEIGRVVQPDTGDRDDHAMAHVPSDWTYVLASRAVLHRAARLTAAGDLVGAIYENWDGTGLPDRRRKGEIPLRARILRVLVDLFAHIEERQADPGTMMDVLAQRSGTWYDPLVLRHLEVVLGSNPELPIVTTKQRLATHSLEPGMILAADLRSASGVLLLSEGSTITERILDLLRERDQADPIIEGAWIKR